MKTLLINFMKFSKKNLIEKNYFVKSVAHYNLHEYGLGNSNDVTNQYSKLQTIYESLTPDSAKEKENKEEQLQVHDKQSKIKKS